MKLSLPIDSIAFLWLAAAPGVDGFLAKSRTAPAFTAKSSSGSALGVSIGLGPDENVTERKEWVAGVDYEVPNHEEYRLSRRSKLDEQCDDWYGNLLGEDNGVLGSLAVDARKIATTTVPLTNDVSAS